MLEEKSMRIPQLIRPYIQKDGVVLDIGAGTGNLSRSVLEVFSEVKAVFRTSGTFGCKGRPLLDQICP